MSDNWVVQNLENALEVWNDKLSEIWQLITQSPQTFKGGSIWSIICSIHGALQAIGYALLVLFFVVGVVKTCGSFADLKKPEHAVKLFVRFAIAKGLITYGMELMMAILEIIQGVVSTIMNSAGFGSPQATVLPQEIITAVEDCGFFESIPARRVKERKIYRYINGEKIHHTISPKLGERCRTDKSIYYAMCSTAAIYSDRGLLLRADCYTIETKA